MAVITEAPFNGTPLADLITGSPEDDAINGFRGDDTINGGDGNDNINGGFNQDLINGGNGNDVLIGDRGIDTLVGGAGSDTFVVARAPGSSGSTEGDIIADFNPAEDKIGLGSGITFDQLDVRIEGNNARLVDRLTGQPLAIVTNITSLSAANFTSVPVGDFGRGNVDLNGLPEGVRVVGFFNLDDERAYYLSSSIYTDYANQRDTRQRFVSFDFLQPPSPNEGTRVGPLPHTHFNEFECFFVVDGTFTFTVGMQDGTIMEEKVSAGQLAYGPQGRVHGFRLDPGTGPGRIYSFALPAGLDDFFVNSGDEVGNRYNPIPPITLEEISRTAFWAQQRNDALFIPNADGTGSVDGRPVPTFRPDWPDHHSADIYDESRPEILGPFGETRRSLLTPEEVGAVTGQFAWKGTGTAKFVQDLSNPFVPFRGPNEVAFLDPNVPVYPGGTISYDYISLEPGHEFAPLYTDPRDGFNLFYTLDGELSLQFANGKTITVPPLTFIQIPNGVAYSIANFGSTPANTLAIDPFNAPVPGNLSPSENPGLDFYTLSQPPDGSFLPPAIPA
ncbi:cupin domain-containing protein [Pseudanabaena sp. PCC 6802]|uniref:cupin domain-containing protein n=1 Tax=Pseudanabaena sp. PCC 6802 TaxID=118173 RepID=UPI00034B2C25|nr:cupin domain-containing protein [Pseudanabaena sp. PCC 6802]